MIFLRNDDGKISVYGGEFATEADFSVHLLGQAGDMLETTIRLTTREGTAVYLVDGAQPLGAPSLHARLLRVEPTGTRRTGGQEHGEWETDAALD